MVAAEYDGDLHRSNRNKYVRDMKVHRKLEALGWKVIRVIAEDRDDEIIRQTREALRRRGWRDS